MIEATARTIPDLATGIVVIDTATTAGKATPRTLLIVDPAEATGDPASPAAERPDYFDWLEAQPPEMSSASPEMVLGPDDQRS